MPWIHYGDGEAEVLCFRFQRTMRRVSYSPLKRYTLALDKLGEDNPYVEHLRRDALAWVQDQMADIELELIDMELRNPQQGNENEDSAK